MPVAGSITGAMIADHTIGLVKLDVSAGSPLYVLRINGAGTTVEYTDPQNLFDATHRLPVDHISLSAVGAYVLTSDGVTNTWITKAAFFTSGVVPLTAISTSGAANPSVLSYDGATLAYRTVVAATANDTIPVTKLLHDAALNMPRTNSAGTALEWATPAQIVATLLPYINTGYRTPTANQQAIGAAGSINTFPHGLGARPFRAGGYIVCVTAYGAYSVGDTILWETIFNVDSANATYMPVVWDATNVYLIVTPNGAADAQFVGYDKTGGSGQLTKTNWKVMAWADVS
ncbi:MAG: hypothetical protein EBR99_06430 [Actinobacteria bacterium]|nr:hypothetical protein [Actinomycetota bacterium]